MPVARHHLPHLAVTNPCCLSRPSGLLLRNRCAYSVVEVRTHPTYTAVDGFERSSGRFVSWHSAEAVTRRIRLSCLSELLVKLEISLTLSGEIDNSNVKEVEEVSR